MNVVKKRNVIVEKNKYVKRIGIKLETFAQRNGQTNSEKLNEVISIVAQVKT